MSIKCARCGEASHMNMCQRVWRHLCVVSVLVSGIVCCVVGGCVQPTAKEMHTPISKQARVSRASKGLTHRVQARQ